MIQKLSLVATCQLDHDIRPVLVSRICHRSYDFAAPTQDVIVVIICFSEEVTLRIKVSDTDHFHLRFQQSAVRD